MRRRSRSDFAKRAREARKHIARMHTEDERDMGVRPGMGRMLGFGGSDFWSKARRWLTRPPF